MGAPRREVIAAEPGRERRAFLFEVAGGAPRPITPEGMFAVVGSHAAGTVIGWSPKTGEFARFALVGGEPRPLAGRVLYPPEYPIRAAADRRTLFINKGGVPRKVDRLDLTSGTLTPWKSFLPEESAGVVFIDVVFLTPDGDGYAYTYGRFLQDLFVVEDLRARGEPPMRPRP